MPQNAPANFAENIDEFNARLETEADPISQTSHLSWVDTAKGLGIVLVVVGHTLRGLIDANLMTWTASTHFIDDWIYAFHMPLFFFISGLFLVRSVRASFKTFASNKLRTIAYPYFVWSAITMAIKIPMGSLVNHPNSATELPQILYRPVGEYWFLYVLFVLTLSIGLMIKLRLTPWIVLVVAILIYPEVLPFPRVVDAIVLSEVRTFALYVALGALIGEHFKLWTIPALGVGWLLSVVLAGGVISSLAYFLSGFDNWNIFRIALAVSGISAIAALSALIDNSKVGTAINFLGRYSLEIFVVHTIASATVRIVLQKIVHITGAMPHLLLGICAGLFLPVALALLFDRVGFLYGFTVPNPSKFVSRGMHHG